MIEDILKFTFLGIFNIVKAVVRSLVLAIVFGAVIWFVGKIFGIGWGYFTMVRHIFFAYLALDIVLGVIRVGGTGDYNHRAGRTRWW